MSGVVRTAQYQHTKLALLDAGAREVQVRQFEEAVLHLVAASCAPDGVPPVVDEWLAELRHRPPRPRRS